MERVLGPFSLVARDAHPFPPPTTALSSPHARTRLCALPLCPGSRVWIAPQCLADKLTVHTVLSEAASDESMAHRPMFRPGSGSVPTTGAVAAQGARRAVGGSTSGQSRFA
jgi:hypothetical protein